MSKQSNKYKGYMGPADLTGIGKYFGLARPFDFADRPTRMTLLCSVLAFCAAAAWKMYHGMATYDACMTGLGIAFGLLFSFMLGMELDPDRSWGGFIGGVGAVLWAIWKGEPNFLVMLFLIFVMRMLNRSTGDCHKILDNLLMLFCAWWLGKEGGWLYPLLLASAYILETQLPGGMFYSWYLAAVALATLYFSEGIGMQADLSMYYIAIMAVAMILFLPMLRMSALVLAKGDRDNRRLNGARLRAANLCFMASIFFIGFFQGDVQCVNLAPAYFTAAGVGVYLVYDLGKKRKA